MRGANSRGTRIALGVLGLVALGCTAPVVAGLDEGDASQAVVALEQAGIGAEKERDPDKEGAFRVVVARDDASTALTVLAEEGLPPRQAPGVLEALGRGSMVPSRMAEQARLVTGTSDELERSLRGLDGVLSARVHLGVPTHDPLALDEQAPPATASVLIRHRGATPPVVAVDVQRLVSGAVPGLHAEQVTVVMLPAPPRARPTEHQLARVGPLTVTRSSLLGLRALIGVAVLVNAALLACVLALWARLRRTESTLAESRPSEPERRARNAA
jgi:type III secretion protein J